MSTEYLVVVDASWGKAEQALFEQAFTLLKARAAPYRIEIAFEAFGKKAEQQLSKILDKHSDLFRALESFTVTPLGVALRWNGYGDGETFLEQAMLLLKDMGLADMRGQAVGDEGAYHCLMKNSQLDCRYVDEQA